MKDQSYSRIPIDGLVSRVETWNPQRAAQDLEFDYIDIASIDRESKAITQTTRVNAHDAPSRARQRVRANDVLVSTVRPNLNAVAIVPDELNDATASTGYCVLRCVPDRLYCRYLYHWVRTPQFIGDMTRLSTGANYPAVSDRIICDSTIALPYAHDSVRCLQEQKRIAAILDQADVICRKRRQMVEITDGLIPAIFNDRFGDHPERNGHPVAELGDHADVVSGVTKGRRFNGQTTLMLPYLRVANVQDGRLDLSEIKTVEALPSDLEKYRLQPGDVLLTEGGDHDKLGRGALWEGQVDDCIHQNHIFRVRVDCQVLLPVFFANYLQTAFAKAYFLRCAKKTTNLATINMRQLRALPIPLPPIGEQQEFLKEVDVIASLNQKCTATCHESDELFASLVQRAFRGEL